MSQSLDPTHVLTVIKAACHATNADEQQLAMKSLEQFESIDGFVTALCQIVNSHSAVAADCRLMASIILKNMCKKCWVVRGGSLRPMSPTEQHAAKALLSTCYEEPDRRVVAQLAAIGAQIARHDWPTRWPDLFPFLMSSIQNTVNPTMKYFGMGILREVISETSRMVLFRDKFVALALELMPIIGTLWLDHQMEFVRLLNNISSLGDESVIAIQQLSSFILSSIDIVNTLLSYSFDTINRQADYLPAFFANMVAAIESLADTLRNNRELVLNVKSNTFTWAEYSTEYTDHFASKYRPVVVHLGAAANFILCQLAQIPITIQRDHVLEVVPYLEPFLTFYFNQLASECALTSALMKSIVLPSVLFIGEVANSTSYTPEAAESGSNRVKMMAKRLGKGLGVNEAEDARERMLTTTAISVKQSFFSPERVTMLLDYLLRKLFSYSAEELEEWENEPEEFFSSLAGLLSVDSIRVASDKLYLGILQHAPGVVVPLIVSLLQDTTRQVAAVSSPVQYVGASELMYWDAVYLCAGISAEEINSSMDASAWLTQSLSVVLQTILSDPSHGSLEGGQQLLRSRMMWLLPCWMYYWDDSVTSALANLLVSVLDPNSSSDIVVVLNAVETLDSMLRSASFAAASFAAVMLKLTEALCALVARFENSDSRTRVIEIVGELAIAMGAHINPVVVPLTGFLGGIWSLGEDHSPLRAAILQVLATIVKTAKDSSVALHSSILPLISHAIEGAAHERKAMLANVIDNNEEADEDLDSYLFDSGITLWLAILRNTPHGSFTIDLNNLLVTNIPIVFGMSDSKVSFRSPEELQDISKLVEAYGILGGSYCLRSCSSVLKLMYDNTVGQVSPRVVPYLMRPLEAFFLTCPDDCTEFLLQSGHLAMMIKICAASFPVLKDAMRDIAEAEVCVVAYLSIIARVIITKPDTFTAAAQQVMIDLQTNGLMAPTAGVDTLVTGLLRQMLSLFDYLGSCSASTWRKKLWSLAFLSMYPSSDQAMLEFLIEVVNNVDATICEEAQGVLDSETSHIDRTTMMAASMSAHSTEDSPFVSLETSEPIVRALSSYMEVDIVFSANLQAITKDKLIKLRELIGDGLFGQLLNDLAPQTIARLQ